MADCHCAGASELAPGHQVQVKKALELIHGPGRATPMSHSGAAIVPRCCGGTFAWEVGAWLTEGDLERARASPKFTLKITRSGDFVPDVPIGQYTHG